MQDQDLLLNRDLFFRLSFILKFQFREADAIYPVEKGNPKLVDRARFNPGSLPNRVKGFGCKLFDRQFSCIFIIIYAGHNGVRYTVSGYYCSLSFIRISVNMALGREHSAWRIAFGQSRTLCAMRFALCH